MKLNGTEIKLTPTQKKLEPDTETPTLIKTEVGIGYRLATEGLQVPTR